MKKISYCFLAIALLWCCSQAVAFVPTTSGKPNQGVSVEKPIENQPAITTHVIDTNPELTRPQSSIDPALTSTNVGGANPEITGIKQNSDRAAAATNPNYKKPEAVKLQKEMAHKSTEGVAIPPDPNVILQGGDNIVGATAIPSLPYSDAGTTAGYTNDYAGSCGYDAGAPDVVYSYAPASTEMVKVSLCGSSFDTRLYIFQNDASTEIACNDDYCNAQSEISVNLNPGSTYYFVVDGYNMDAGAYTISVSATVPCMADTTVNGPGAWIGTTCGAGNDSPLRAAEDRVYAVNLPAAGDWIFSLCGSSETWDTYLFVGSEPCSEDLGSNDDFCGPMSQVTAPIPGPGTYYVTIEGFQPTDCGAYEFRVMEPLLPPLNDSCSAAIPVTTYPSTVCGTVAGATVDCPDNLGWPAVWYSFYAPYAVNRLSVDYCGTGGMIYEVGISVFNNCDDCVFTPADDYVWNECDNGFLNPSMNWYNLPGPATYYFAAHTVGVTEFCFTVDIEEVVQCDIICPAGSVPENEPLCGFDYIDVTNGGCNSDPPVFQQYTFGDVMCGQSGTYIAQEMQYRDTDWYRVITTEMGTITWNVYAEFPVQTYIYYDPYGDCGTTELAYGLTWTDCDTVTISAFAAQPGTYYMWVGPIVFSGVDCGSEYVAWGTWGPPPPCTPDYVITAPGTTAGTTCGMGNDWSNTCLGSYDDGQDILYEFTLSAPMTVDIILDPLGTTSTSFALASDCYMQNCIVQHGVWPGTPHGVTSVPLAAGTYYLMVDMWPTMEDCIPSFNLTINESAPPPPNNDCGSVTPVLLNPGTTLQFTGNNAGATLDCSQFETPEVWHAITINECMNLTIDLCGTTPAFANAYLAITDQCPCGNQIFALDFNNTACIDGNVTSYYYHIPPGTYYIPVLTEIGSMGPYLLNVTGVSCPPPPPPDFIVTAPGTWTGNTCGAISDCYIRPAEEHIYQVTIPNEGTWRFSLCNTPMWWDSFLLLGTTSCSEDITVDDDYCRPLSEINVDLAAGTYFLSVEGFRTGCGEYTLDITEVIPPPDPCDGNIYINHGTPIAGAMATQCDPVYPFQAGCADDFILSANTEIDQVVAWMGFWDGPLDPNNITGINVIFYADNNGVPGGRPMGTDPACGYQADIPNGLISVQQVTTFTTVAEPTGLFQFLIDIPPVSLTGGTTYWVEVSPVMNSAIGGQVGWAPSDILTGHSGVLVFTEAGVPNWGPPLGVPTDFAFCLHGTTSGGCIYLRGDINNNAAANGIDVVYGVNYFKGAAAPPVHCDMCPQAQPFYAAGDVNGNCAFNGIDITFFVNYLKGVVPALLNCPTCPPAAGTVSQTPAVEPIKAIKPISPESRLNGSD